ncbi:MAG: RDD family protein [Verrucomicrobiota bacterium]
MEIYIKGRGQRLGPYSVAEINRRLATGALNPSELAWHEKAAGWEPLFTIAGVILPGAASASTTPIGIATPIPPESPVYAGFWIRAIALFLDSIILTIPIGILWFVFWPDPTDPGSGNLYFAASAVVALKILYFTVLWASPMQATLGQKMCGLRVITETDNPRISFARAVGRLFAMGLSSLTLGIGYLMAAFTERKRALHDMLAGTCVVKAR